MRVFSSLLLLAVLWGSPAYAEIEASKAVHAILGEAGPSYAERRAIAFALRNRGHLGGVYGYSKAPSAVDWQNGSRAWHEALSGNLDPVRGATHWLSDWDLKHAKPRLTKFRFKMTETAYIGTTHFYKERA